MCNKLIVLSVALVVVGLSVPALAVYIGFDENGDPDGLANPLKVDIDSYYSGTPAPAPLSGWQGWDFPGSYWQFPSWTGPIHTTFNNPLWETVDEVPSAELNTYRKNSATPNVGFSVNRSGGFAYANGSGEYGTAVKGFGTTYLKLTIDHLKPLTHYKVILWSWDRAARWAPDPCNPNSKYGVWSTLNPLDWLNTHGYSGNNGEPNGYGPINQPQPKDPLTALPDTNMPCDMWDAAMQAGGRTYMMAPDETTDYLGGTLYRAVLCCLWTDNLGNIVLYGWIDPTDWTGSQHMPLNGFMVVPEPATVALLGLGGLALLRRKRA